MPQKSSFPSDYITPLNINNLEGRLMHIKSSRRNSRKEILFVYDLNSNLERWFGLCMGLKRVSNVTMVDLPGIGGMDNFYQIGMQPNLNNYADYLASLIKLRFNRKKVTLLGYGFGSVVIIRMLERNKEISKKIQGLAFINGYSHFDDIADRKTLYERMVDYAYKYKLPNLLRDVILANKFQISSHINKTEIDPDSLFIKELENSIDHRSNSVINREILRLNNCKERYDIKAFNLSLNKKYSKLNNRIVNEHFKVIFKDYKSKVIRSTSKTPFILKDVKDAKLLLDRDLLNFLRLVSKKK